MFVSLITAYLLLPRRLGRCRSGWLFVLVLQSAGSGWISALTDLCFWRPRRQQHQSGIWNMVRNCGFKGCLQILSLFSCDLYNGYRGRRVRSNYKYRNLASSQNLLKLLDLPQDNGSKAILTARLSDPKTSAKWCWILDISHPSWLPSKTENPGSPRIHLSRILFICPTGGNLVSSSYILERSCLICNPNTNFY